MARKTIPVNIADLQKCINSAEDKGPLTNQNLLFGVAAELYNRDHTPTISGSVVYLRVREHNLKVLTPKGKRGRVGGFTNTVRKSRGDKFSKNKKLNKVFNLLKQDIPPKYTKLVNKVIGGSMQAAVKLNCLSCTDFQSNEVKKCTVYTCPMWAFRPFQEANNVSTGEI